MTEPNIATASVLPRLRGILTADINSMNNLIKNIPVNSELVEFLNSLVAAKEDIKTDIPSGNQDINQGSPNAPQKDHLTGIQNIDRKSIENQVMLLKEILKSEESQLKMVKSATDVKGLPSDLQDVLTNISRKYMSIIDQIGRSVKTQQLGTIVI